MLKRLFASRKKPCFRPGGPWQTRRFDLSGCQLEITLPPHDQEFAEDDHGDSFNLFDPNMFSYETEPNERGFEPRNRGISYPGIFLRKWNTYGPIWEGPVGFLQCSSVVCDISRMKAKLNCFNKDQMEQLLIHSLYFSKGPGGKSRENTAPVNWQIKNLNGAEWIYCESWERKPDWIAFPDPHVEVRFAVWMVTPLFHDKYLMCTFSSFGTLPAAPSNQLMMERIHNIIPSLKITLSPEAAKQKAEAEQLHPNAQYSPHRDPEPWRYYESWREGDLYAGEDEIVLEGECTPPPELK